MSEKLFQDGAQKTYGSVMDSSSRDSTTVTFAGAAHSSGGVFDRAQFDHLRDTVTSNIYQILKQVSTLERTVKTIGTKNDTDAVRESVHTVTATTSKLINDNSMVVKQLNSMVLQYGGTMQNKTDRLTATKLTSEFQQAVKKFQEIHKTIVTKMKSTMPSRSGFAETEDENKSLVDAEEERQSQLQLQQQLEFEQGLLIERENRIRQIETDIVTVNDIMKDLAQLVVEQRDTVDTIEANIDSTHAQVEQGAQELQKAQTYQRKYRKKLFCLLAIGFVVLVVVIVILIVELKN